MSFSRFSSLLLTGAASLAAAITASAAPAPGSVVVGDLAPGESVTLAYDVVITKPLPVTVTSISHQVSLTADGIDPVLSDDPETVAVADATVTWLYQAFDYGDAPDPAYPTRLASNGARHLVPSSGATLYLGATPPGSELDAKIDVAGDGAEEDGVTLPASFNNGQTHTITVVVTGGEGLLNAWIDWNHDGDWSDDGEHIIADRALAAGSHELTITAPAITASATTFARFRLSSEGGLGVTGAASDGEVEDYEVTLSPAPTVTAVTADDIDQASAGGAAGTIVITFADQTAIDVSTIDASDISVTGPAGGLTVTSVAVAPAGNGSPRTATYTFTAPGGTWDDADNGTYTVALAADAVRATNGLAVAAAADLATFAVSLDTTAPGTEITSAPADPSNATSASFTFTGSDAGTGVASFEASLDGGAFTAATSPLTLTGLAAGPHTFAVRAVDGAGNVDGTPASYGWTVDITAPVVSGSVRQSPATEVTFADTATFRVSFSEAVAGVDPSDFTLTATGTAIGDIGTVQMINASTFDVGVTALSGSGTLRLDVKAAGNGITDAAGNALAGGFTTGATYTLNPPPAITSALTASATYGTAFDGYTITGTYSPASYSATGLPAGLTLDATSGVISGTPTISGTFNVTVGATNVGGTGSATLVLTVAKAALVVTADDATRAYGAANPAFTATITGFVNGDTSATALTGTPALTTTATALTGVGTVAITAGPGTLAADHYVLFFAPGTLTITRASLTVTADDQARAYGANNPTLTATISGFVNGETADGVVTGAAVLSTTATQASAAGDYAITAAVGTLAANNYTFTFVPGTLSVTKAPLTVRAADAARIYGDTNPAFAPIYTGFVNGETAATALTGEPVLATTATDSSDVGSYAITAAVGTLAATNYAFTFVDGTLTLTKANLTVTANDATRAYGAANPAFAATITGFKLGQTTSVLSGTPSFDTVAGPTSDVGDYPITPGVGTLAATNYGFSFAPGTLTVTKAPLTVTADDATRAYGQANPAFTATITGFVNGEQAADVVTGDPEFTTTATIDSAQGDYLIVAALGTLEADNYAFTTFVDGTLTITPETLTVTADPQTRVYGEANPTLTYTLTGFVNGDTAADVTGAPVLATSATSTSNVGNYAIEVAAATLSAPGYVIATANGTLTVTKAELTVTADDATRAYGEANPAFTATITGLLNGDTRATATTGAPAISTIATATSDAGTYAIDASAGSLAAINYTFTFVDGTLTIDAAEQTITFPPVADATFGDAPLTLGATASSGLPVSYAVVSGLAEVQGNVLTLNGAGAVTVEATQAGNTNYTAASAVRRSFTVAPAVATVALGELSQTYSGSARVVAVQTTPAGLAYSVSYDGANAAPVGAGSYAVVATVTDPNYTGSASGTLVVAKAAQSVAIFLPAAAQVGVPLILDATATSGLPVGFELVSGPAQLEGATLTMLADAAVRVRAVQVGNANYEPAATETTIAGATKRAQTIDFAPIDERRVTDPALRLQASATSGLPVTFSLIEGPATLDGTTLTFSGLPGIVVVRASQPGDAVWAAAAPVERSIVVAAAGPAVFFGETDDQDKIAGSLSGDRRRGSLIGYLARQGRGFVIDFGLDQNGRITGNSRLIAGEDPGAVARRDGVSVAGGRAAAATEPTTWTIEGTFSQGVLTGTIVELGLPFTAVVEPPVGDTADLAGYYEAPVVNTTVGGTYTVVGTTGSIYLLAVTPNITAAAGGAVTSGGAFSVPLGAEVTLVGGVDASAGSVSGAIVYSNTVREDFTGVRSESPRTFRMINLSSRGSIERRDRIVIAGLVVHGPEAKPLLIRGVGPALSGFVSQAAADPRLTLFREGVQLAGNDDWHTSAVAEQIAATGQRVGAFPLAAGSADAALLVTLEPGAYTLHLSDASGTGGGVGLVEVYDASTEETAAAQRLVNLSSRGGVQSGHGTLISGFVVTGNAPKRVLVRGAGPALSAFGVSGSLADPVLRVYNASGAVVARNDQWEVPQPLGPGNTAASAAELTAVVQAAGAFAFAPGSTDAALIVTLAPGIYTAHVTGAAGGTGEALIEIYELEE